MTISNKNFALAIVLVLVCSFGAGAFVIQAGVPDVINETLNTLTGNPTSPETQDNDVVAESLDPEEEPDASIDSSIWYPGETVSCDYTFKKHFPIDEVFASRDSGDTTSVNRVSSNWLLQSSTDADDDESMFIDSEHHLTVNYQGFLFVNVSTGFRNDTNSLFTIAVNCNETNLYIDATGRVRVYINNAAYNYNASHILSYTYIRYWNSTAWERLAENETYFNTQDINTIQTTIYEIYYQLDDIVAYIPTRYHYTSFNTKEHELSLENFEYGVNLTLDHNPNWDFATINPNSDYVNTTSNVTFYNTIPVTYRITFTEKTQHYYAMEYYNSTEFEDPSYNCSVFFTGSFSERKTSGNRAWTTSDLEYGKFMVTYACYIEEAPTAIVLQYYNGSWLNASSVDVSYIDSWQVATCEVYPTSADSSNLVRLIIDGSGIVFWDNIVFWKTNIEIKTTGYNQQEVSFTPVCLDGYQNQKLDSNELFNVSLLHRHNQTTITSWNRTSKRSLIYEEDFTEQEYSIEVISCTTSNISEYHFTPLNVTDFDYASEVYLNETSAYTSHWGVGGWDFTEGGVDGSIMFGDGVLQNTSNGMICVETIDQWDGIEFDDTFDDTDIDIDPSYYNMFFIRYKVNATINDYISIWLGEDETWDLGIDNSDTGFTGDVTANEWSYQEYDVTSDSHYTPGNHYNEIRFYSKTGITDATTFWIDMIGFMHRETPGLYESSNHFTIGHNEETTNFRTWINDTHNGDYLPGEEIPKNITTGDHLFEYCAYRRDTTEKEVGIFLETSNVSYTYTVAETGNMYVVIYDQSGEWQDNRKFKIYIDTVRIYGESYYFSDTSATFNLTITDLLDNSLYSNSAETYVQFKEVSITKYSVKIQNQQFDPIWVKLNQSSAVWSEWVFNGEVIEYHLATNNYTIRINYTGTTDILVSDNGTSVSYTYEIDSDTALFVTATSLQDVFDNILTLQTTVENVNTTLATQILNVNISLTNVHSDINTSIVNVNLDISSLNSTIDTQLTTILNNVSLVQSTINSMEVSLSNEITVVDSRVDNLWVQLLKEFAKIYGLTETHVILVGADGLGFTFETFPVYVLTDELENYTRIYDPSYWVLNETVISVQVTDWFGRLLANTSVEVYGEEYDVICRLNVLETTFSNYGYYPAILRIYYEEQFIEQTVAPGSSYSRYFSLGEYYFEVWFNHLYRGMQHPLAEESQNEVLTRYREGYFSVSSTAPAIVTISTPYQSSLDELEERVPSWLVAIIVMLLGIAIATIIICTFLVLFKSATTEGIEDIKKKITPKQRTTTKKQSPKPKPRPKKKPGSSFPRSDFPRSNFP